MDELDVIRDLDDPVDGTVLTTWHDKEPVDEHLPKTRQHGHGNRAERIPMTASLVDLVKCT